MQEFEKLIAENNLNETKRCINHMIKITKWLVALSIINIIGIVIIYGMTLKFMYAYEYNVIPITTTETYEQSTEGGGNAIYIGGDGNIGETEGDEEKNSDNKTAN